VTYYSKDHPSPLMETSSPSLLLSLSGVLLTLTAILRPRSPLRYDTSPLEVSQHGKEYLQQEGGGALTIEWISDGECNGTGERVRPRVFHRRQPGQLDVPLDIYYRDSHLQLRAGTRDRLTARTTAGQVSWHLQYPCM
jgi:hypothetical protein